MSQPSADPLFLAFQQALAGRYYIDREIGRGGMGIVYLAREVHLDRMVAIKLFPPELAERPALRDGFVREARLAAKLSHPNIVPIHAVDEKDGYVFFVMPLVEGVTLAERVRTRGPLSASEGARVLREVAWALDHAHGHGVVHRDVKPDNVLLETATGRALVADFGIAAITGEASTGRAAGTPEFMSPEQALGREVDARSDLYSLGVTAYYALSGRLPFEGKSATEILARHVSDAPEPLASLGIAVPRKLALLVDRCLAKDPADRPASAQALAEQLGVAIEQRRELPAVLRGFVKRGGRMDSGGTVIYLSALVGVGTFVSAQFSLTAGFATLVAGAIVAPLAFVVNEARRLLSLGFTHDDLAPAFRSELESAREELAVQPGRTFVWLERAVQATARVATNALIVALPVMAYAFVSGHGRGTARLVWPVFAAVGGVAALAAYANRLLQSLHREVDTEFWGAFWNGPIGTLGFTVARRLHHGAPVASAMTHRATELSLGMAAEQLYESLPKAARGALGALPELLRRLQDDAQALRARYEALNEAITQSGAAAADDAHTPLREERDLAYGRLRDAVGALETIRLNLLRMHAGSMSVQGITTHIEIASELSDEVRRLIASREAVDELLRYPSEIEPTPV
ncbi:MAG: bifunctional serine/threonine protein kinase/MFS transporter [Gemmatimonadota bacterium]